jgi:hypothetical protein
MVLTFQTPGIRCTKFDTPEPYRFVTDGDTTLSEQIFDVAMAEIKSVEEPNGVTDDIGWESVSFVNIHGPILSVTTG